MPELDKIVDALNTELVAALKVKGKPVNVVGICDLQPYEVNDLSKMVPVLMKRGEDGKIQVYDDRFAVTIYHRIIGTIVYAEDEGYGDAVNQQETANMICVVCADPVWLKQDRHRIMEIVAMNISRVINLNVTGMEPSVLELQNIITDSISLYGQEYRGYEYNIPPEHLLFGVSYQIVNYYDVNCFSVCPEC
jgi:hypothetical protein